MYLYISNTHWDSVEPKRLSLYYGWHRFISDSSRHFHILSFLFLVTKKWHMERYRVGASSNVKCIFVSTLHFLVNLKLCDKGPGNKTWRSQVGINLETVRFPCRTPCEWDDTLMGMTSKPDVMWKCRDSCRGKDVPVAEDVLKHCWCCDLAQVLISISG
jgi:hypothetical protein